MWIPFRTSVSPNIWYHSFVFFCMFLTLQCGQGLLITVDYDGLLRCGCTALPGGMILIVKTLHVKLQMSITVKPKTFGQINITTLIAVPYHLCSKHKPSKSIQYIQVLWWYKLFLISPLSTKFAWEGFLIGVCHHVPSQVFLVLGSKAAVWTLVRTKIGMLRHVSLKLNRY